MRARVECQVWLPKAELGAAGIDYLKKKLTINPRHAPGFSDEKPSPVMCWSEDEEHPDELGVPRDFFFSTATKEYEVSWLVSDGSPTSYNSVLRQDGPYAEQGQALSVLQDWLEGCFKAPSPMVAGQHLGALLKADPGFGKTNTALELAHRLGRTTVILVHKERLMMQWKHRAEKFLPGVRVGIVREDECDYENKDIVIAMMQSLAMERLGARYPREFYRWPGLLLIDEAHRVGANTWAPIPMLFPARWRVALTATPRRKDGCDKVFWWHIGAVRYDAKTERPKPAVRMVDSGMTGAPRVLREEGISPSVVVNVLTKMTSRNQTIVSEAVKALRSPSGRKLLILSERLEQIRTLDEMLAAECKRIGLEGVTTGFYVGQWFTGEKNKKLARNHWNMNEDNGRSLAIDAIFLSFRRRRDLKAEKGEGGNRKIFARPSDGEPEEWIDLDGDLGEALNALNRIDEHVDAKNALDDFDQMLFFIAKEYDIKQKVEEKRRDLTEAELTEAERARVIWMTYQMCSEGIDIPPADTLGFASPISDIEQTYGRGRRECVPVAHGGDKTPAECEHYCPWRAATCTGKPDPIAFDIVDRLVPLAKKRQRYREEFYRDVGAKVRDSG